MPELISSEYKVYLSPDEQDAYDEMKKQFILDLPEGEISAANAAALSGKLSQMANGAIYDDAGNTVPIHEQKLDALEDIIESANGKPLLVAYWYQHDLERIMKRLHERHIPFCKLDKADSIRRWNNGEIPVALIHPASAGHGLNLQTGGNTIVYRENRRCRGDCHGLGPCHPVRQRYDRERLRHSWSFIFMKVR